MPSHHHKQHILSIVASQTSYDRKTDQYARYKDHQVDGRDWVLVRRGQRLSRHSLFLVKEYDALRRPAHNHEQVVFELLACGP